MKHIGFLSFGHWTPSPQSPTRSAADALLQTIDPPSPPRRWAITILRGFEK